MGCCSSKDDMEDDALDVSHHKHAAMLGGSKDKNKNGADSSPTKENNGIELTPNPPDE